MAGHTDGIAETALFIREETVRLISIAKTGHYASTFSCAEILAVLYDEIMRLRHGEPDWPDRDRLLLGKGHAAVGVYPLLVDSASSTTSVLDEYTRLGNPLGDHPDMRRVPGIDFSSGSLGHALSVGPGHGARRRACRRGRTASSCCSATASCTRARSGRRRCPPRTTARATSSRSSTATASPSTARSRTSSASSRSPRSGARSAGSVHEVDGHDVPRARRHAAPRRRRRRPREARGRDRAHGEGQGDLVHGVRARLAPRLARRRTTSATHTTSSGGRMPEAAEHELRPGSWHLLTARSTRRPGFAVARPTRSCELADAGHPVVVGTADLKYSNGLVRFERAPSRPLHPVRHLRAEHGLGRRRPRDDRHAALRRDVRVVPRAARAASRSAPTSPTRACPCA